MERKSYQQSNHVASLIAEDITSRFLNIITLLNGSILLVAIQLNAIQIGDQIALIFTVVLDHRLGLAHDEEEVTDRTYWEKRSSKITVDMADEVLGLLKTFDQELTLKYNKFYISVSKNNKPFNIVIFRPKTTSLGVEPKLKKAEKIEIMLDSARLNVLEYDSRIKGIEFISLKMNFKNISVC